MRNLFAVFVLLAAPALADSIAPVDAARCAQMKAHHVLSTSAPVGCERLRVVSFSYVDFDGHQHDDGAVVVLDAVAPRTLRIFQTLHERGFAIAKAQPLEAYEGDDAASMADNNTSGFNDRPVAGTPRRSLHAYGVAIDLDPLQNPFLTVSGSSVAVAPPGGVAYLNRRQHRPGKTGRPGLAEAVVSLFAANGFAHWGGDWDDPIDYQHFDIGRPLAESLTALPPDKAQARFEASIAESAQESSAKSP